MKNDIVVYAGCRQKEDVLVCAGYMQKGSG